MNSTLKLVVQLNGGLCNQMFQYAAAYSLAKRNGVDLVIDTWSGFVRDKQYRRHYELDVFPISGRKARPLERIPFWIHRVSNKVHKSVSMPIYDQWYGVLLNESRCEFMPEIFNYRMKTSCWMTGYWQSAKYFVGNELLIKSQLLPPVPQERCYYELGQTMQEVNSVALGVRIYEESANPSSMGLKSITAINEAARQLTERKKNCHFFVFCTYRASLLDQLRLNGDVTFVTHDDGFNRTLETLWLITKCRHHIITNSSFYWWGAWLSRNHNAIEEQVVFASDYFGNKDSVLPQWHLF